MFTAEVKHVLAPVKTILSIISPLSTGSLRKKMLPVVSAYLFTLLWTYNTGNNIILTQDRDVRMRLHWRPRETWPIKHGNLHNLSYLIQQIDPVHTAPTSSHRADAHWIIFTLNHGSNHLLLSVLCGKKRNLNFRSGCRI